MCICFQFEVVVSISNNNEIKGNLVVSGCSADIGGNVTGQRVANAYLSTPDLPQPIPTTNITILGAISSSLKLPRSTDPYVEVGGVRKYQYLVDSIDIGGKDTVTILPGKKSC